MRPTWIVLAYCAYLSLASEVAAQVDLRSPSIEHPAGSTLSGRHDPPLPNWSSTTQTVYTNNGSNLNNGWVNTSANAPVVTASSEVPVGLPSSANSNSKSIRLNPPSRPASELAPTSSGGSTLQMLLSVGSSLLITLGLFLGIAWCYRKTVNTGLSGLPKSVVSILGRTPLAARQQLVLVRFGSKLVLVSLIQGEARTISEITDPLEVDQLAGLCESHQPTSITNSFKSILQAGGGAS